MKRTLNPIANFLLIVASTATGLGIGEYLTMTLAPQFRSGQWTPKQVLESHSLTIRPPNSTFRQRSNSGEFDVHYSINELGFRDRPLSIGEPKRTLIFVGDSFTEGYGVEQDERFSEYATSLNTNTVVGAVSGYNIKDYIKTLSYLRDNGVTAETIVIGLCVENDIMDYDEMPINARQESDSKIIRLKHWLNTNSSLFNMLATSVRSNATLNKLAISIGLAASKANRGRAEFNYKEIRSSVRLLSSAHKFGKHVIILIIPDRRIWSKDNYASKAAVARLKLLRNELAQSGFDVVDVTDRFNKNGLSPFSQYHFPIDGHWNADGHRTSGEMIANKLSTLPSKH